jgi:hypothetical protein
MTTEELTAQITQIEQMILAANTALTGTLDDSVIEATFHTGTYGAYQRYKKMSPVELLKTITILQSQLSRLRNLQRNGSGLQGQRTRRYG